jgi:hypothetical protein
MKNIDLTFLLFLLTVNFSLSQEIADVPPREVTNSFLPLQSMSLYCTIYIVDYDSYNLDSILEEKEFFPHINDSRLYTEAGGVWGQLLFFSEIAQDLINLLENNSDRNDNFPKSSDNNLYDNKVYIHTHSYIYDSDISYNYLSHKKRRE